MKKIISLTLCLVMLLSMTACKTAVDGNPSTNNTTIGNAATWGDKTVLEIMQQIADKADTQIMAEVIDGSEFYQNALSLGELQFNEIALYMPMMSSQRFEVAVIRVAEGTDVASYVADLESRAANAQWMCAAPPDFVKVVAVGDCVLYMAINSEFADEDAMVKAFQNPAV